MEFATIYLNECSQIPQGSRDIAVTRLGATGHADHWQQTGQAAKASHVLRLQPAFKGALVVSHVCEKRDPETKKSLANPEDYACFQINPQDNAENISAGYLETLQNLSSRLQKRFSEGRVCRRQS